MKIAINSKTFSVLLALISTSYLFATPAANAAYTVLPKVGQCFNYTKSQVSASYASKNPISCSALHNMETFAVAKWPLSTNPVDLVESDTLDIVNELCGFWDTFPNAVNDRLSSTKFNFWAWYSPSRAAWAKGQRWIRCDAMIGKFSNDKEWPPASHISWTGLKLNKYS